MEHDNRCDRCGREVDSLYSNGNEYICEDCYEESIGQH